MLKEMPASTGRQTLFLVNEMGRVFLFFLSGLVFIFSYPFQLYKILNNVYFIGAKSLFVVAITGAFTGMVLGLQGYYTLVKFGSEGLLGTAVSLTLIRELGPVLTAIMIIGRAGSATAAEIGIMRISEQIDALITMDINPVKYLISPRIAAAIISFPLLTAVFDVIGIFGGYLTGSVLLGINSGTYFSKIESGVMLEDIIGGFYKSIAFAVVVITICCYQGYFVHQREEGFGARGVSIATTSSVVISCVLVLVVDYVLTSILL
jgi:phospholipid/cholesterol/gamma-HCH transport system permease protein